jgi:RND family efflux transporter MFP subunit
VEHRRPGRLRRGALTALAAVALIGIGAGGATLALRQPGVVDPTPAVASGPSTPAAPSPVLAPVAHAQAGTTSDVDILLTPETVRQAGIRMVPVTRLAGATEGGLPGTVTANAYREVRVTPVAGGIVRRVHAELGTRVRRGAPLATVFSSELAEAQTRYLSMLATLDADRKRLERSQQLAEIGAVSRQQLDDAHATHATHASEVNAARQRLRLLGLTDEQLEALVDVGELASEVVVPAPIAGVVTARTANLGQVVSPGQELFVVTDLSTVWVLADLYEQQFAAVQVGSKAVVTSAAYPGLALRGRVAYVDPRVDAQTRTAKVRVEVPNGDGRLKLGMYVLVGFTTPRSGRGALAVPRTAVQTIGERHVVYLARKDEPGRFIQRVIRVGAASGDAYVVLEGLEAGDEVVTEGSFLLRAEALRNAPS